MVSLAICCSVQVSTDPVICATVCLQVKEWGTGGMATKLAAARIATAAGTTTIICNSRQPESVVEVSCALHHHV